MPQPTPVPARGGPVKPARKAAATAGLLGGAGGLTAALGQSPVTVYVLGALALITLLIAGTVVLTPVLTRDDKRARRALTVLQTLLSPGSTRGR